LGVSDRDYRYNDYHVPFFYRQTTWRHVNERLLLSDEYLWLVGVVETKRRRKSSSNHYHDEQRKRAWPCPSAYYNAGYLYGLSYNQHSDGPFKCHRYFYQRGILHGYVVDGTKEIRELDSLDFSRFNHDPFIRLSRLGNALITVFNFYDTCLSRILRMEKIPSQKRTTVKRIVLFGPESTGKTTLAKQLSERYDVPWVAEYARTYLQEKWDRSGDICQPEDLVPIAIGQIKLENKSIIQAENDDKQFIVCDTDLLETLVYSEVYYNGWVDQRLLDAVSSQNYDLYLLTGIDVPWIADDLRDKPHEREKMYEAFRSALEANGCNYISLQGNQTTRLEFASAAIEALF